MMKKVISIFLAVLLLCSLAACREPVEEQREPAETTRETTAPAEEVYDAKPVIYLYPETPTAVTVKLDYSGALTCTYPDYRDGWNVLAQPDGTLTDLDTGLQYTYLYWEGISGDAYDMSKGFVVKGSDTAEFLRTSLEKMGLTLREYNEFIVYWLPQMEDNPYNLITFQQEDYTGRAKLTVTPEPDSVLRVFMAWKPLAEPVEVEEPVLTPMERTGFTVVEWGGAKIS